MSELKITITQLEDLLDRQRQCICDHIINNVQRNSKIGDHNLYTDSQIVEATRDAQYPQDFIILRKYVK